MLGALALAVAVAALVVTLTRGDPEPDLSKRVVYVSNASAKDDIDDKEIRANCPRGTLLVGGGSAVQHGNETPSVAMYQGFPVDNPAYAYSWNEEKAAAFDAQPVGT